MRFTIRTVAPSDLAAVNSLHRSVGWPQRSVAGWHWLMDNPARLESGAPAGWLLESGRGEPCGFMGNFVQRFHSGDRVLHGATGFSIIVRPGARGQSRTLLNAFTAQTGMFAVYVLNANPSSSPIFRRHAMTAWPPTTHDLKLAWSVDLGARIGGRLWREVDRRAPHLIHPAGERLMNRRLSSKTRLILPEGVETLPAPWASPDYGNFWTTLKNEGRLLADRSPAILHWRLTDPDLTLRPLVLAFRRGGTVTGYAMAMLAKNNPIEVPVLEIVDLVAVRDEPDAIAVLTRTLLANTRALGGAKLRIQTVNEDLLRRLGPLAFSARQEGGWGHGHARFAPGSPAVHSWAPTPFDGDHSLCLRPVPVNPARQIAA